MQQPRVLSSTVEALTAVGPAQWLSGLRHPIYPSRHVTPSDEPGSFGAGVLQALPCKWKTSSTAHRSVPTKLGWLREVKHGMGR